MDDWLVGPHPDELAGQNPDLTRPATFFLDHQVLVTEGVTHAMQWERFADRLQTRRRQAGEPELRPEELHRLMGRCVVLYLRGGWLELPLARNDRDLLLEADSLLQRRFPKHRIRFLGVSDAAFIETIRRRGELWRISPPPMSWRAIQRFIQRCRSALGGDAIYYQNPHTGTRYLTYEGFASLETKPEEQLAAHLVEIAAHLGQMTRQGTPELVLWPEEAHRALAQRLRETDWSSLRGPELRKAYAAVRRAFEAATPANLRRDLPENQIWRDRLFEVLGHEDQGRTTLFADEVLGPLFRHQIRWLPGLHFERGECVLDSVLNPDRQAELGDLYNPTAIEVMRNTAREYVDLEFLNIGEIPNRLRPGPVHGRRQVFLLDFKRRSEARSRLLVARFQKYGIREHLAEGDSLVDAILAAQDYTEYILDRRLGCRQLGMPLPEEFIMQQIPEKPPFQVPELGERLIWATYFTRDFLPGTPTPDLDEECLGHPERSLAVARLMGEAGAVNLVVGRVLADKSTEVNFDYGNEIIQFDQNGHPIRLIFCHHEGAFGNFEIPLTELAKGYARPVNDRTDRLPNPRRFAETYLQAFRRRYAAIREEYLTHKEAFQRLFHSLMRDPNGSFGTRWDACLQRLDSTPPEAVTQAIRARIACLPSTHPGPGNDPPR